MLLLYSSLDILIILQIFVSIKKKSILKIIKNNFLVPELVSVK
jgi:hypothetical protein